MRPCLIIGLLMIALVSFAGRESVRQSLERKIAESDAAFKRLDINWFDKNTTSDFEEIGKSGTTHKAAWLAGMRQMAHLFRSVEFSRSKILSVQKSGQGYVVKNVSTVRASGAGPNGKVSKFFHEETDDDTWVKVDNAWKLKRSKTLSEKTTINGKVFPE